MAEPTHADPILVVQGLSASAAGAAIAGLNQRLAEHGHPAGFEPVAGEEMERLVPPARDWPLAFRMRGAFSMAEAEALVRHASGVRWQHADMPWRKPQFDRALRVAVVFHVGDGWSVHTVSAPSP